MRNYEADRSTTPSLRTARDGSTAISHLPARFSVSRCTAALCARMASSANRYWGNCAHSNRRAAAAVSFSPLRRELLDRTNIAYATLGMKGDLGLTDSVFGTASGIFFIGYLGLQIPGALLVERWSARLLLAITLITWGALTTLTGFVRTPLELYGARFLLGAAEAGFFPGVIVYLSHWFIYRDRAKAVARFMSAIPIAAILGAPWPAQSWAFIGWGFLDGAGSSSWKECPRSCWESATLLWLPDRPAEARWLRAGRTRLAGGPPGRRATRQSTRRACDDLAGASAAAGAAAHGRALLLLHRRLRLLVLDADDAPAAHRLD